MQEKIKKTLPISESKSKTKELPKNIQVQETPTLPHRKLSVLMVAAEVSPYVSVGGASSVIGHLSKALKDIGHDVRVFIPKFGLIDENKYKLETVFEELKVPTDDEKNPWLICNVKSFKGPNGVIIYFLENQEYYETRANVYGYSDDPTRFALLSRGVLEFIKTNIFVPDVIHCNDWHTGAIPNYLKTTYKKDPVLSNISTIFTIHNIAYQGSFDHRHVSELEFDDGKSLVAPLFSKRLSTQNFVRRGIIFSDAINTVSKNYSKEILTPEFGEGLDKLLLELKGKLFGIINGLDYDNFNPKTDNLIEKNYDINSLDLRAANKKALQKEFDLDIDPKVLLLGFVGRLDFQKGVDMMVRVLTNIMKNFDVQFVQVGGGDWGLAEMLQNLKAEYPGKAGIHPYPNFTLPRLLFSGCDCIVYPSRFEPCGIVQLEAMRYGAIPIVRKVGGLADTVVNYDSQTGEGNGFVFDDFDEYSLYGQIVRAVELYKNKEVWRNIQYNAMKEDFSWKYSATEYTKLYERSFMLKNKKSPADSTVEALIG